MAQRPVFISTTQAPYYKEVDVEFTYYNGFAVSQKQKSIKSLHEAFLKLYPEYHPLEISTKSDKETGIRLSAFNLKIKDSSGMEYSLESAFQGGKIFKSGGPYTDLLGKLPWEVKKDPRLKESGPIIGFVFDGNSFSVEPKSFFYDWLYINAVHQSPNLETVLMQHDAFTDIEFNPKKSLNCQARSAAICKSLKDFGLLENVLQSPAFFLKTVYGNSVIQSEEEQIRFL